MLVRALTALMLSLPLALAACSPPMTAASGYEDEIAAGLGPTVHPLASGLYRVTSITSEGETMPYAQLLAEAAAADPPEPLPLSEIFALQYHPASGSYAMLMSTARVYPGADGRYILEYAGWDDTIYLPLEVSDDRTRASVLNYSCVDIPEAFRAENEIGRAVSLDCDVYDGDVVRAGLALIDADDTARLEVAFIEPLPDLGG